MEAFGERESSDLYIDCDDSRASLLAGESPSSVAKPTSTSRATSLIRLWLRNKYRRQRRCMGLSGFTRSFASPYRAFCRILALFSCTFAAIAIIAAAAATFFPSYTHLPPHYESLRERALASSSPGRVNLHGQKVFIAANIYDKAGKLVNGAWSENVLDLIQLLGPKNVFLSIYMNDDSYPEAKKALESLKNRVPCDHELVLEDHMDSANLPHAKAPDGLTRVKRIAYLAEARNRALRPLDISNATFDKLLFLNDAYFHPIDAAHLLFSTHTIAEGKTDYRAACAVDFINPFKFYDTFATRDLKGYNMGMQFFPWFSVNGDAQSHRDVVDGSDAVRVRSCWGGLVAFEARFFQKRHATYDEPKTAGNQSPSNLSVPYRFRAESEPYWEASECCLIHADIQNPEPGNSEIYMNPFVRVAYDAKTLSWLGFTRRFEHLYTPIHFLLDVLVGMPTFNPRRHEEPWQKVEETIWIPNEQLEEGGSFHRSIRLATHAGFCGRRDLQLMKLKMAEGEDNWESLPVPP